MTHALAELDRLLAAHRAADARRALDALFGKVSPWSLRLREAQLLSLDPSRPVDEALLLADALIDDPLAIEQELGMAHAIRIRGYGKTRCRPLVSWAESQAGTLASTDPAVLLARGQAALCFDQRERAKELFQLAIHLAPDRVEPRLALSDLLYMVGDFRGCVEQLDGLGALGSRDLRALRIRAACAAATEDVEAELAAQGRLAELGEQEDRVGFAVLLALTGQRSVASERLRAAWLEDPDSDMGRYARARLEHLERAGTGPAARRLAAFPTTRQKWDGCGPAVLELCLQYLDVELDPEEIAKAVKRERGTPMYEIVRFLRECGIVTRRIEATPERLKTAIDHGLPVIVQEEYATTAHVAVITGYDGSLGLFVAHDPITHRPMLKSFEWTQQAGELFGNGGVIVLGREGQAARSIGRKLDRLGVVTEPHLVMVDDCDRRRPRPGADGHEDAALGEVLRLCSQAIELSPRFRLAWYRRLDARMRQHQLRGRAADRARMLADLHHVRTEFGDDEWTHQLHAHYLFDEQRYDEAFVEYLEASRRDPADANNLQSMGECKWLSGDLAAAESHMLQALAREPTHVRAMENLAGVYLRQLQEPAADTDGRAAPTLGPKIVHRVIAKPADVLLRRATHFNRVASHLHPHNGFNHEIAGDLHARAGRWTEAELAFARAADLNPSRQWPVWGRVRALEALGRQGEAGKLLADALSRFWVVPQAWLLTAQHRLEAGEVDGAIHTLLEGLRSLPERRSELLAPLLAALQRRDSEAEAADRLRRAVEATPGDAVLVREAAFLLDDHGQIDHATELLRHAVARAPHDVGAKYRLAELLSRDLTTRDEAEGLLREVVALSPGTAAPRQQLAWLCLDRAPDEGLSWLEPVLRLDDPYVHETRATLLAACGRSAEAEEALSWALRAHGEPAVGLVWLCTYHMGARRFERALTLAQRIAEREVPEALRVRAEHVWLAAHRHAGQMRGALPRLRDLCRDGVPPHLQQEVFRGCLGLEPALAVEAASRLAAAAGSDRERRVWLIHEAGARAAAGDPGALVAIAALPEGDPELLGLLAGAHVQLDHLDLAERLLSLALARDPDCLEALAVMEEVHVRRGRVADAMVLAHRIFDRHPRAHQGPERLALLFAKSGSAADPAQQTARAHADRALYAAPSCHRAQRAQAVTRFVAADGVAARERADRALGLQQPVGEDPADDAVMIIRAIDGEIEGLERCLSTLHATQPETAFAPFKARLREVALAAAHARR